MEVVQVSAVQYKKQNKGEREAASLALTAYHGTIAQDSPAAWWPVVSVVQLNPRLHGTSDQAIVGPHVRPSSPRIEARASSPPGDHPGQVLSVSQA